MHVNILNAEPEHYSPQAVDILQQIGRVELRALSRNELLQCIQNYHVLIVRLGHKVDNELLAHATHLKVIATATTGLNHIDVTAAQQRNIAIVCLKGEFQFLETIRATSEHTWGLLLALLRHVPAAQAHVHNGQWNRNLFRGTELFGKTLGILGHGRLGKIIAHYAHAFGMNVIAYDPVPQKSPITTFHPFDFVVQHADVLSVHVPYEENTVDLINADTFARMKPNAVVVNTSRGGIINEAALLHALNTKQIAGAAVDVLAGEYDNSDQWPMDDSLVHYAKTNDNLIITPHISGATWDSMRNTEIFIAQKLVRFFTA